MRWAAIAYSNKGPNCHAMFDQLLNLDRSDWRDSGIHIPYVGQHPFAVIDIATAIFRVVYQRRWSVPITSKFRGVWEVGVDNLLLGCMHNIGQRIAQLMYESKDLFKVLQSLTADSLDDVTAPESVDLWRCQSAVRSSKLLKFYRQHARVRKLWRSVQITELVYRELTLLMAQSDFDDIMQACVARWSVFTLSLETTENPVIDVICSLSALLDNSKWEEYGCWFYNGDGLPPADVLAIESHVNYALRMVGLGLRGVLFQILANL